MPLVVGRRAAGLFDHIFKHRSDALFVCAPRQEHYLTGCINSKVMSPNMQHSTQQDFSDAQNVSRESDLLSGLVQYLGFIGKSITSDELVAGLPVTL